jgi:hypothetical protein
MDSVNKRLKEVLKERREFVKFYVKGGRKDAKDGNAFMAAHMFDCAATNERIVNVLTYVLKGDQ